MNRRTMLKNSLVTMAGIGATKIALGQRVACFSEPIARQPEGPFYPVEQQVDTDADLTQITGSSRNAKGRVILVQGVVSDQHCVPVPGVLVEIWQACATGKYNHPSDPNTAELDPDFQYWGKAVTNARGQYRFRTIVPGAYPAAQDWIRPPHIHFKVAKVGYLELITQMYFANERYNTSDRILQRLSQQQQQKVIIDLKQVTGQSLPTADFNITIEKLD